MMAADVRTATLPPRATSPRRARRMVSQALAGWALGELEDTATLLVSELVTNGLLHARTGMRLHIRQTRGGVRVEVRDGSAEPCVRRRGAPDALGGRGLDLVSALSDEWGTARSARGKIVWFELRR